MLFNELENKILNKIKQNEWSINIMWIENNCIFIEINQDNSTSEKLLFDGKQQPEKELDNIYYNLRKEILGY